MISPLVLGPAEHLTLVLILVDDLAPAGAAIIYKHVKLPVVACQRLGSFNRELLTALSCTEVSGDGHHLTLTALLAVGGPKTAGIRPRGHILPVAGAICAPNSQFAPSYLGYEASQVRRRCLQYARVARGNEKLSPQPHRAQGLGYTMR